MNYLIGILAFILMLGVIIVIHEAGHFMAARAFGVHCHEFSFGMGPLLWQKQGKHTLFSIRAFPIGGYVSMAGETDDDPSDDEDESEDDEENWMKNVPDDQKLNHKPVWQQMIVMVAGVVMNFLLAFGLLAVVISGQGKVTDDAEPVVYEVIEGTPAQRAGLMTGDRILKITAEDGSFVEPKTQNDVSEFLIYNHGESEYLIEREGEQIAAKIEPRLDEETNTYMIGFTSQRIVRPVGFFESFKEAWLRLCDWTGTIFRSIGMLLQGKGLEGLSGPVGIYQVTHQVVSYGWLPYLSLCAMISLNIGIFNLLPIPALDGGRVLILLLEKIFRRKIPVRIVEGVILASFLLLFGLMIFSTYNDIARFFA